MRLLLAFFSLTYLLSWTLFAAARALSDGTGGSPFGLAGLAGPVLLVGVFAPGLVAVALTLKGEGRAGVTALFRQIVEPRVSIRWYVFAVVYFATVKLVVALLHRVITGAWPLFGQDPWYLLAVAIVFSTPTQIGEELGWRAFALPRLAAWLGLPGASILLGVIWATWHLPLFAMPGADTAGQSFPLYLLDVTALSIAIAWLYWRTNGRLLLTMLMHAAINNTKDIVPSTVVGATNRFAWSTSTVAWLTAGVLWICAIYLLVQMRGAKLTTRSLSTAEPTQAS
jgi:membrane protease YdiL (CAAX protease family)